MIYIRKSETADTRTCDVTKVDKSTLIKSSQSHISDVQRALSLFEIMLYKAGKIHDHTKLLGIDQFYADFKTGFKTHDWWDSHRKQERHHIGQADGVREDVDLIDVLEFIADCVTAGMARSGSVYELKLPDELLQKAMKNTVDKLKAKIVVYD
jgi:hypothetical protein